MFTFKAFISRKTLIKFGAITGLMSSCLFFDAVNKNNTSIAQGNLEFRWNDTQNYKKLRYLQSSTLRLDRSTYYFLLRKSERNTAILKLSLKFPDYFEATIKPKNITLCKAKIGGYTSRTKCTEKLPAVIEIDEEMKTIDIFPQEPIPSDKSSYAVLMKLFNPRKRGMYQINAFSQSPGELPISLYLGSYTIEIE